jgi:hypothetical protein
MSKVLDIPISLNSFLMLVGPYILLYSLPMFSSKPIGSPLALNNFFTFFFFFCYESADEFLILWIFNACAAW